MQRISLVSLNLWNTEHWEQRKECVVSFVKTYRADIYCFQEVRVQTLSVLDEALPAYRRIEGTDPGWQCENSIYIKQDLFSVLDLGRVDLSMPEPYRGVFWVKLKTIDGTQLLVATMHLTHQLNADELRTGVGYRHAEAHSAARALQTLAEGNPAIICGDFNDPVHPSRIFSEEAHFRDVFTALGLSAPVTFPCPYLSSEGYLVEAIDKIMIRGTIRPVLATSPHFMTVGGVLSDHWPVAAVLEV
ncbi:MAG: endonuclease/exonuclease/phosphatase family protein [Sphaerochaeta sp.]|jgi:endonuclease/exonuclease/phosphatase family metal-dependent hydrolase|uniref:endonuclease/exonuclease/phosphatase family protein n=1 Tax=Sphaerochaeta sp. TaxID=1972642 RepID=UPI002FCBC528